MKPPRILIIDDEPVLRDTLQLLAEDYGFEAITAQDPRICAALSGQTRSCETPCADIALVDLSMPVMDGLTFIELHEQRGCKIPKSHIALMTACLEEENQLRLQKAGCHFFQKPTSFSLIAQWIRTNLDCASD